MVKSKRIWIGIITVVCMISIVLGCTPAPTSQPTPTPVQTQAPKYIVIGQLMDYSGPYKTQGAVFKAAADAFERYFNEEKGGIDGAKVKFIHYDFQGQSSVAATAVKQGNMESKPIAWVSAYSGSINAAKKQCAADQVLMVGLPNSQGLSDPASFVLITRPFYEESFVGSLKVLGSTFKGPGKLKWGILAAEGFPSALSITKSSDKIAEITNTELIFTEWMPTMMSDPAPFIAKMEATMPNYVLLGHVDPPVALLLKAMAERGLQGKVTPIITCNAGPMFVRKLAGNAAINGLLVSSPYASYTEADKIPLMATANRLLKQVAPDLYPPDLIFLQAWVNYITITEGVAMTAKKVGWENMKSSDLRDTLISGAKIETGGISPAVYWKGPNYNRGLHSEQMVRETATGEEIVNPWYALPDWYTDVEKK